jgi:hypothetical protein
MKLHAHELDDLMTLELEMAEVEEGEPISFATRKLDQVGMQGRYRRQSRQFDDGSSVRTRSRK